LLVARYLTELRTDELEIREMLKLAGLVLIPTALVMKQPDLGTSLTYLAVLIACAFLAGLRWKYVAIIAIVTVVGLPISWQFLNEYQKGRIVSFMDPERDPQGKGYQLIQSQIAVGSGGMFGKGVTKGLKRSCGSCRYPTRTLSFRHLPRSTGLWGLRFCCRCFLCW
jgi:rod shape determining protein RodA